MTDRTVPIDPPARIRVKSTESVATHRVAFSDLDRNGHMNSIRYIDILLDAATVDPSQSMRRIDISYAREARFGDTLYIFREDNNNLLASAGLQMANADKEPSNALSDSLKVTL